MSGVVGTFAAFVHPPIKRIRRGASERARYCAASGFHPARANVPVLSDAIPLICSSLGAAGGTPYCGI